MTKRLQRVRSAAECGPAAPVSGWRDRRAAWLPAGFRGAAAAALLACTACVYRIDIQQGNLLEASTIDQVELGMTRSQVQFLLGTPMISDSFHQDRWDYTYYFRRGRSRNVERQWFIVFFEGDQVVRMERDPSLFPAAP